MGAKTKSDKLSDRQRDLLFALADREAHRVRAGWDLGGEVFSPATGEALVRRGLAIRRYAGTGLKITPGGRLALRVPANKPWWSA